MKKHKSIPMQWENEENSLGMEEDLDVFPCESNHGGKQAGEGKDNFIIPLKRMSIYVLFKQFIFCASGYLASVSTF